MGMRNQRPAAALPPPSANQVRIIGGAWRRQVVGSRRPRSCARRRTAFRDALQLAGADAGREALPRSVRRVRALTLEAASRAPALAVAVGGPDPDRRVAPTAAGFGATAVEAGAGDARAFLATERRDFDVIFLDPPFGEDPWPWLLPACAARLLPGGFIYAEAARALEPPPGLAAWRRDKAGQVHYHLFVRADAAPA
jgi:16S rRNA (guanine966-N2)-methyltransferase